MSFELIDEQTEVARGNHNLEREVASAKKTLIELFDLLEEYAPGWYSGAHHDRAVAAIKALTLRKS